MIIVEELRETNESSVLLKEIIDSNPTNMPSEIVFMTCQAMVKKEPPPFIIKDNNNSVGVFAIAWVPMPPEGTRIGNLYLALDFKISGDEELASKLNSIIGNYMEEYDIVEIQCSLPRKHIPHIILLLRAGFYVCGYIRSVIGEFVLLSRTRGKEDG